VIVVADTSPLNYLLLIRNVEVLPALYGAIIIPSAVLDELTAPSTPDLVRTWASTLPKWVHVQDPSAEPRATPELDEGERQAIALAQEVDAELILVDDAAARDAALQRGLEVVGTLGVLLAAARLDLLNFERSLRALDETSFYMSERLRDAVLSHWRQNRND
jgi:predicted nucleic acid-binding protein